MQSGQAQSMKLITYIPFKMPMNDARLRRLKRLKKKQNFVCLKWQVTWVKILMRTGTRVGSGIRHLAPSLNQTPPRSVSMLFFLKFHLHMDRTIIGPWLAIFSNSRIKISSFLAMNIKKCVLLAQKLLNFLKLPQTKNGNYNSHVSKSRITYTFSYKNVTSWASLQCFKIFGSFKALMFLNYS